MLKDLSKKPEIRIWTNEEIAQLLVDSAFTDEELADAHREIVAMGLKPSDFIKSGRLLGDSREPS